MRMRSPRKWPLLKSMRRKHRMFGGVRSSPLERRRSGESCRAPGRRTALSWPDRSSSNSHTAPLCASGEFICRAISCRRGCLGLGPLSRPHAISAATGAARGATMSGRTVGRVGPSPQRRAGAPRGSAIETDGGGRFELIRASSDEWSPPRYMSRGGRITHTGAGRGPPSGVMMVLPHQWARPSVASSATTK